MTKPAPTIIPGTRYGHLVTTGVYIPSYMDGNKKIRAKVECKCDCGSTSFKQLINLRGPGSISCGSSCFYYVNDRAMRHGLTRNKTGKDSKEYSAWSNMIGNCNNPSNTCYKYIGAKGITYHESLATIEGFLEVMGKAPSKYHRFTRIDKDGDFEPGNVHWYLSDGNKKS